MSIGRIMYSKMPTKRKLSDFYGFGLPSIIESSHIVYKGNGVQKCRKKSKSWVNECAYSGISIFSHGRMDAHTSI